MSRQRESKLSSNIQTALRQAGCFCFKVHGSEFMAVGLPDIIVCVDGHFLGLEVKMPGKQSTFKKAQKLRADQIRAAGGWSEVVTSVEQALDLVFQLREKRHQHLHPGD